MALRSLRYEALRLDGYQTLFPHPTPDLVPTYFQTLIAQLRLYPTPAVTPLMESENVLYLC